ncbi:hypothetical protein GMOD_00004895 [Pyrenophora seminiperda CCB06]|uniref:Uncharacterized protein n=1 Tax=Pyrenophora seminiperda CCB06 TaxID=1302712 RepID=A0A3M7MHR3_9PLEO|nr:hypothetical protein GMOD_00004895 [Pyrenophora seminiperda CCB06]
MLAASEIYTRLITPLTIDTRSHSHLRATMPPSRRAASKSTPHSAKLEHLDNSKHAPRSHAEEEISNPEPDSQDTSDVALARLMAKMIGDQRKRYTIQKTSINTIYTANVSDMEDSINTLVDTAASSSAHQAQLQHLQQLLAQKASIEASMSMQLESLKAAYDAHSRDLEMVVQRFVREIK